MPQRTCPLQQTDRQIQVLIYNNAITIHLPQQDQGVGLIRVYRLEYSFKPLAVLFLVVAMLPDIEKAATGLQIKIDDTPDTLDVDSDGLKVVGLPSLFKVNGTAVGATVTAPNFDTLTDGSNADALHTHAGVSEAQAIENSFTATEGLTLGDPVYIDTNGNAVSKATAASDTEFDIHGVAKTTVTATSLVDVVSLGPADVLSGATAGDRYYLAAAGGLSTSVPAAGNWVVRVGWAMDANTLFVMPRVLHKRFA